MKQLHFIVDTTFEFEKLTGIIEQGISHIQLRDKQASTGKIIEVARQLQPMLKAHRVSLIINDRVDIALCVDAEGVHLGQSDMPYLEARKLLGPNKIIGLTIEALAQAKIANQWQVDYIGVGPIFQTKTKLDAIDPIGLANLELISQFSNHPIIAIGGITSTNLNLLLNSQINGIAVASAIDGSKNPGRVTATLRSLLNRRAL